MSTGLKINVTGPWSDHEVEQLIQLLGQGVPEHYLCDLLGRRLGDVSQKMRELAVAQTRPEQPEGAAPFWDG